MEESVWITFGVISAIILIGIVYSLFSTYQQDSDRESAFQGIEQLGIHAEQVCRSPKGTKLSIDIPIPSGSVLYTTSSRICATLQDEIKCVSTTCALAEDTLLNLTDETLLRLGTRTYRCSVERTDALSINCEG